MKTADKATQDQAAGMVIYSLSETDPATAFAWATPRLAEMDEESRAMWLGPLGLAVAATNPQAAREFYQQLKQLLDTPASRKNENVSLMQRSSLVALAGRLKEPEAPAMLGNLIRTSKEMVEKQGGRDRGVLEAVIEGLSAALPISPIRGSRPPTSPAPV